MTAVPLGEMHPPPAGAWARACRLAPPAEDPSIRAMIEPSSPDVQPFDALYVDAAARILGVLRHPTRLHLVLLVAQGETHVSRLSDLLALPQSNVSHHLSILRNLGLVADRREGQFVLYRIHTPAWRLLADGFFDHLLGGSDEVRLQNFLVRREPDEDAAGSPQGKKKKRKKKKS
jgi:DNA-binding transcriptional ArsR family regulator